MTRQLARPLPAATALAVALTASGCDVGPKPIRYGRDECAECKMSLVDRRYGAELVTAKGKIYIFDDLNCLVTFQRRDPARLGSTPKAFVVDFARPASFVPADQAVFLQHEGLRPPMASGLAGFASETELDATRRQLGTGGRLLRWPQVLALP
ncbi:MAG: hypothetical protein FJ399_14935 [Verrucomicrobia bacterium]|nr:hypothetical protein [Verrucomicrobiota bacterium]